eukprot:scaffold25925_cov206-Skeletonema_menzelii.AAC.4
MMGSMDNVGRNGSGELDVTLGESPKKAAPIPLTQRSLSLGSSVCSIQTDYNQESDLRDEINHDEDMPMGMRETAEVLSPLSIVTSIQSSKSRSSKQAKAEVPLDVPNSVSLESFPFVLSKSQSSDGTKSALSKLSFESVSSSMLEPALEGNVLWSIMNHEIPHDLNDELLAPPPPVSPSKQKSSEEMKAAGMSPVPPSASIPSSVSAETPEERIAAGFLALTPRAATAVAEVADNKEEDNDDSIFPQVDMKSTQDTFLKTSSSLTEKAGNTRIEMSYSGFMDASNKEKVVRDSTLSSTNAPAATPARKQVKWSSKILGRTGGKIKNGKAKSILKRFKKKRNQNQEEEDKLCVLVEESTEEGDCGEFECAFKEDSIETSSVEDANKIIKEANDEKEDTEESKETEMESEATAEPSAPAIDDPVVLDTPAACAKPVSAEPTCSFQEMKDVMFALMNCNPNSDVPETQLDKKKARELMLTAKQLYSQRELIKEKSAELDEHWKLIHGAQTVASYQSGLEKNGILIKELSDAKGLEASSYTLFKSLFSNLSSEERGYAVMLGNDVARAAQEVKSLHCDALLEIEMAWKGNRVKQQVKRKELCSERD